MCGIKSYRSHVFAMSEHFSLNDSVLLIGQIVVYAQTDFRIFLKTSNI